MSVDVFVLIPWAVAWFVVGNVTGTHVIPRLVDVIRERRTR